MPGNAMHLTAEFPYKAVGVGMLVLGNVAAWFQGLDWATIVAGFTVGIPLLIGVILKGYVEVRTTLRSERDKDKDTLAAKLDAQSNDLEHLRETNHKLCNEMDTLNRRIEVKDLDHAAENKLLMEQLTLATSQWKETNEQRRETNEQLRLARIENGDLVRRIQSAGIKMETAAAQVAVNAQNIQKLQDDSKPS